MNSLSCLCFRAQPAYCHTIVALSVQAKRINVFVARRPTNTVKHKTNIRIIVPIDIRLFFDDNTVMSSLLAVLGYYSDAKHRQYVLYCYELRSTEVEVSGQLGFKTIIRYCQLEWNEIYCDGLGRLRTKLCCHAEAREYTRLQVIAVTDRCLQTYRF